MIKLAQKKSSWRDFLCSSILALWQLFPLRFLLGRHQKLELEAFYPYVEWISTHDIIKIGGKRLILLRCPEIQGSSGRLSFYHATSGLWLCLGQWCEKDESIYPIILVCFKLNETLSVQGRVVVWVVCFNLRYALYAWDGHHLVLRYYCCGDDIWCECKHALLVHVSKPIAGMMLIGVPSVHGYAFCALPFSRTIISESSDDEAWSYLFRISQKSLRARRRWIREKNVVFAE